MSDDIVKEIRESRIALHSTAHKAADEIEKLREELDACDEKTKELCDEITRLRADLAAVTAERDRMREALKPFADAVDVFISEKYDAHRAIVTLGDLFHARAALEGVTEPASPWRDIESAPKDGTKIVVGIYFDGGKYPEEARWDFWVDSWRKYASGYGEGFGKPARPTVWMPLPEPPR